jgi:NAD-dependent SIR2 family protein deacetylase
MLAGARVIEVNPNPTDLTARAHAVLAGPSGRMLPALIQLLKELRST